MNTSLPSTLPGSTYLDGMAAAGGQPALATPAEAGAPADFASVLGGATGSPAGAAPATGAMPAGSSAGVPPAPSQILTNPGTPTDANAATMFGLFANITSLQSASGATAAATEAAAPVAGVSGEDEADPVDPLDRDELEALLALVAPLAASSWQVSPAVEESAVQVQGTISDPKSLALARQLEQLAAQPVSGEEASATAAASGSGSEAAEASFPELRLVSAELELSNGARVMLRPDSSATSVPAAEKTAVSPVAPEIGGKTYLSKTEKTAQGAQGESVESGEANFGIDVAKTPVAMPQPAANSPQSFVPTVERAWAGVAATESIEVGAELSAELPVRAGEVVQAVVDVVEAQAASRLQPVPSVTVRFDMGEGALAVRVEMRDGEVRTEFKTDSRELQSALAHEWRSVATTLESGVRLADPVFTTTAKSENAGSAAAGGDSFSQSRSSERSPEEFLAAQSVRGLLSRRSAAVDDTPVAVVTARHLPTSQRLSVLA